MATWFPKYRTEFTDILGLEWRTDIEEFADASGTITTMQATGAPLFIEYLSNGDDLFEEPINGSIANISVYADTNFQYANLYAVETSFKHRVSIYYGTTHLLYWQGYVSSNYQEPYDGVSYPVTISATDGLGTLKDIPYDNAGTPYNGRMKVSEIIINILSKIGAVGSYNGFTEYVNIYEERISSATTDSLFDQTYIDVDIFKDTDCYTVLKEILKTFKAVIRQKTGSFVIYRPTELSQATVYGRVFISPTEKFGTSTTPEQLFDRTAAPTDLRDIEGGTLMIQGPAKKVTINQDYGYKDSWLDNWEFKSDTFEGGEFEGWTQVDTPSIFPVSDYIFGEESGAIIKNDAYNASYKFYQDIGVLSLISASDYFVIEFEWGFYNTTASQVNLVEWTILVTQGDYTLCHAVDADDETTAIWLNPVDNPIGMVENAPVGWSGWTSFKRQFTGLEENGTIRVELADSTSSSGVYYAIKNLKFYCTSTKIVEKKIRRKFLQRIKIGGGYGGDYQVSLRPKYYTVLSKEPTDNIVEYSYIKENSINGEELEYDCILGDVPKTDSTDQTNGVNIDNIIEQFPGALAIINVYSLTDAAADFVTDHAAEYVAGGVVVTQGTGVHTNDVIFTAATAGIDFTGNTTITNTSGNLSGTVVNTQANAALEAEWQPDFYYLVKNKCSNGGVNYICKSAHFNQEPPDGGYWDLTDQPQARIDTITLSGSTGSANIFCDGVTKSIGVIAGRHYPSAIWSTRGNTESKPLLQIMCDEIAEQYSRPKQLLSLPILENNRVDNTPHVNILGNFKDILNVDPTFDIRNFSVWTVSNCTLAMASGYARYTTTDTDSYIHKASLSIVGSTNYIISIRYKVISGTSTGGRIVYATDGHGISASYYKAIGAIISDGQWHDLLLDMSDLTVGGTDWTDSIITEVRFYLTDDNPVTVDLDYIGFARTFVLNSADFNVRDRAWSLDLIELI